MGSCLQGFRRGLQNDQQARSGVFGVKIDGTRSQCIEADLRAAQPRFCYDAQVRLSFDELPVYLGQNVLLRKYLRAHHYRFGTVALDGFLYRPIRFRKSRATFSGDSFW